jgi:hypothetical protein
MKRFTVIKSSSLPKRPPIGTAVLYWLLLDRLGAPGWAYGVLWSLIALFAIAFAISLHTDTPRDVPGFGEQK